MEASHRGRGWQTIESPGAVEATFMSWYTVDTRISGGSVRVILKVTLLSPVPFRWPQRKTAGPAREQTRSLNPVEDLRGHDSSG